MDPELREYLDKLSESLAKSYEETRSDLKALKTQLQGQTRKLDGLFDPKSGMEELESTHDIVANDLTPAEEDTDIVPDLAASAVSAKALETDTVGIAAPTPTSCSTGGFNHNAGGDDPMAACQTAWSTPTSLTMALGDSPTPSSEPTLVLEPNALVPTKCSTVNLKHGDNTTDNIKATMLSLLPSKVVPVFVDSKFVSGLCMLWPPKGKMEEWQPWPPPFRVWITHKGYMFRPRPWPSFKYYQEAVQLSMSGIRRQYLQLAVGIWAKMKSSYAECTHWLDTDSLDSGGPMLHDTGKLVLDEMTHFLVGLAHHSSSEGFGVRAEETKGTRYFLKHEIAQPCWRLGEKPLGTALGKLCLCLSDLQLARSGIGYVAFNRILGNINHCAFWESKKLEIKRSNFYLVEQYTDKSSYEIKTGLCSLCASTSRAWMVLLFQWPLSSFREFLVGPRVVNLAITCTENLCSAIGVLFSYSGSLNCSSNCEQPHNLESSDDATLTPPVQFQSPYSVGTVCLGFLYHIPHSSSNPVARNSIDIRSVILVAQLFVLRFLSDDSSEPDGMTTNLQQLAELDVCRAMPYDLMLYLDRKLNMSNSHLADYSRGCSLFWPRSIYHLLSYALDMRVVDLHLYQLDMSWDPGWLAFLLSYFWRVTTMQSITFHAEKMQKWKESLAQLQPWSFWEASLLIHIPIVTRTVSGIYSLGTFLHILQGIDEQLTEIMFNEIEPQVVVHWKELIIQGKAMAVCNIIQLAMVSILVNHLYGEKNLLREGQDLYGALDKIEKLSWLQPVPKSFMPSDWKIQTLHKIAKSREIPWVCQYWKLFIGPWCCWQILLLKHPPKWQITTRRMYYWGSLCNKSQRAFRVYILASYKTLSQTSQARPQVVTTLFILVPMGRTIPYDSCGYAYELCSSKKGLTAPLLCSEQFQWPLPLLACAPRIGFEAWAMDGMQSSICCEEACFQGGRSGMLRAAFSGHVHLCCGYYFDEAHYYDQDCTDQYYLDTSHEQVPSDYNYYIKDNFSFDLVQVNLNHGYYWTDYQGDFGMTRDLQGPGILESSWWKRLGDKPCFKEGGVLATFSLCGPVVKQGPAQHQPLQHTLHMRERTERGRHPGLDQNDGGGGD